LHPAMLPYALRRCRLSLVRAVHCSRDVIASLRPVCGVLVLQRSKGQERVGQLFDVLAFVPAPLPIMRDIAKNPLRGILREFAAQKRFPIFDGPKHHSPRALLPALEQPVNAVKIVAPALRFAPDRSIRFRHRALYAHRRCKQPRTVSGFAAMKFLLRLGLLTTMAALLDGGQLRESHRRSQANGCIPSNETRRWHGAQKSVILQR
jgi:hypothetical protein